MRGAGLPVQGRSLRRDAVSRNILLRQYPWMARDRDQHIDFLRGVAILLVLLLHYALAYGIANCPLLPLVGEGALRAVFYNGN